MAAQTKPVDVLAVMDSCTDELEKQPGCYYTDAAKLQEARAAIAELIEHNTVMRAALSACPCFCQDEDDDGDAATCDRCAALANVGGAK